MRKTIFIIVCLFLAAASLPVSEGYGADAKTLTILYTTDMYGNVEPCRH